MVSDSNHAANFELVHNVVTRCQIMAVRLSNLQMIEKVYKASITARNRIINITRTLQVEILAHAAPLALCNIETRIEIVNVIIAHTRRVGGRLSRIA